MKSCRYSCDYNQGHRRKLFVKMLLVALVLFAFCLSGCSGESNPPVVFPFPIPTDLRISGGINLSNVAIHPSLGGTGGTSMIDLRPFRISIQDDQSAAVAADLEGKFRLEPVTIRDQIVVFARHSTHQGLVFEWMAADSDGLYAEVSAEISLVSTARSLIARCMRDRYGRRINPQALDSEHIAQTVEAMAHVLESRPDKLAGKTLDQVDEVKQAYTAMAQALHEGNSGVIVNSLALLIFLGADNSLSPHVLDIIEDLNESELPEDTQILLQVDLPIDGTTRYMHSNGKLVKLASVGQVDSADPAVLADFVAWSRRAFPAEKYVLVIGSHADGWKSAASIRGAFITDDTAGSSGIPIEQAAWLMGANTTFDGFNRPLDLLVLDACNMGLIELAYEFRDCAEYTVLSQAFVPASGMPYKRIINSIERAKAGALDAASLARIFCEEYRGRYIDGAIKIPATITKIKNSGFVTFLPAFVAYLDGILEQPALHAPVIASLRDKLDKLDEDDPGKYVVQAFEKSDHRDLVDFIEKAREAMPSVSLETDRLIPRFNDIVALHYKSATFFPGSNGLSIALPNREVFASQYSGQQALAYFGLAFLQQTRWDELLTLINSF